MLPCERYLQEISSDVTLSPDSRSNFNYLLHIINGYSELEKNVSLLIYEIYVNSKVEYKSQSLRGHAVNEPLETAKTVLTFMILLDFGRVRKVVKLTPVKALDGSSFLDFVISVIS